MAEPYGSLLVILVAGLSIKPRRKLVACKPSSIQASIHVNIAYINKSLTRHVRLKTAVKTSRLAKHGMSMFKLGK